MLVADCVHKVAFVLTIFGQSPTTIFIISYFKAPASHCNLLSGYLRSESCVLLIGYIMHIFIFMISLSFLNGSV